MKILLVTLLCAFTLSCSQNQVNDYKSELLETKKYVINNPKAIKTYVMNAKNGKIYQSKTDDIFSEFNFEFYYAYDFLRKDEKVVYVQKTLVGGEDSATYYVTTPK